MSVISAHIDRLRDLRPDELRRPDRAQLQTIADDIYNCRALVTTLGRAQFAGFTAVDICAVAEDFGKFRARSNKGDRKVDTILVEELGFLPGFEPSREEILMRARGYNAKGQKVATRDWNASVNPSLLGDNPVVVIPSGYEPVELGRNIRASLAALVKTMPTEAEMERFWTRRYAETEAELTAEHVHLVWWLAVHGLAEKLDELDGKNTHLTGLLVRAHDLLEVARTDAVAAVEALSAPQAASAPVADLLGWVDQASWTHTGMFARVGKVVEALAEADTDRLRGILRSRLRSVAAWFDQSRSAFADIGYLNEAHLRLLVERAGLAHDAVEERKVRNEIRARLTALGFSADLDQELPAGVTAWRQGRLEEFYASREARAAGDPDWQLVFSGASDTELVTAGEAVLV